MGFSKISADADFGGAVWHILPSGEHREWAPLVCSVVVYIILKIYITVIVAKKVKKKKK